MLLRAPGWEGWQKQYREKVLDYDALVQAVNSGWDGKPATVKTLQAYFKSREGNNLLSQAGEKSKRR